MATPFLVKRRAGWYLRIRVPAPFVKKFGKHLVKSLHTTNLAEARKRANKMAAALPSVLTRVDSMPDIKHPITDLLKIDQETATRALLSIEPPLRQRVLNALGQLVDDNQVEVEDLRHQKNQLETMLVALRQARDKGLVEGLEKAIAAGSNAPKGKLGDDAGLPLSQHLTKFFDDQGVSQKTEASYRNTFKRLIAAVGDKPLSALTEAQIVEFFRALEKATKPRGGRERPAAATMGRHATALKQLFGWAVSNVLCHDNLALKCQPSKAAKKQTAEYKKRPFSNAELTRIFDQPLFIGCQSAVRINVPGQKLIRDHRFYFPLVALLTGGRLNELAQMLLSDIDVVDGTTYLFIRIELNDDDKLEMSADDLEQAKRLKTENAKRRIPVHPVLVKLGFLDFIAERRSKKPANSRLFEQHGYGQQYNQRLFVNAEAKCPATSVHSFRHNFKDMVRGLVRNEELQNRLMGHAPKGAGGIYGSPLTKEEEQAFFALQPAISLSHLYSYKS